MICKLHEYYERKLNINSSIMRQYISNINDIKTYNLLLYRLQRIRQRAQATAAEELAGPVEVNPEFLAALPPAIQEEVLAQQRLEQQRHAAASANPEDPVDAAAFFQNLQPSLRQAVSKIF